MKLAFLALASLALSPAALGADLTVGPSGSGADFEQIQAAVDAASSGDRILVAAGTYAHFEVDKPVQIIGEGRDVTFVQNTTSATSTGLAATIRNVPANEELLLSGMTLTGSTWGLAALPPFFECYGAAVYAVARASNNAGRIQLHDLVLRVNASHPFFPEGIETVLDVENSDLVLIDRVRLEARTDSSCTAVPLRSSSSTLWISGSELDANAEVLDDVYYGAPGLLAVDSTIYLARSVVSGGHATPLPFGGCGVGGPGIRLEGASFLKAVGGPGSSVSGGSNGSLGSFGCSMQTTTAGLEMHGTSTGLVADQSNVDGVAQLGSTTLYTVDTAYPTMSIAARTLAPGVSTTLHINGASSSLAWTLAAFSSTDPFVIPGADGAWVLDPATQFSFRITATGTNGASLVPINVPADPSLVGTYLTFQSILTDGTTAAVSNPSGLAIVN